MELLSRLLALCGDGLHVAAGSPVGLPAALFAVGLVGSATHCVGMCGPFVLGQVMVGAERSRDRSYGEWRRLAGAALAPYHLGRATTYMLLGVVAGGSTALFASTTGFAGLSALLLFTAAILMLAQALGLTLGITEGLGGRLSRLAGPVATAESAGGRYALGLILGFLPCGLLYAALAAAAGSASAVGGGIAMLAFALGTAPALIAVGWGGLLLRRRLRDAVRWIAGPVLIVNALLMVALASQRL